MGHPEPASGLAALAKVKKEQMALNIILVPAMGREKNLKAIMTTESIRTFGMMPMMSRVCQVFPGRAVQSL